MKRLMVDERGAISVLAAGVMILMVGMAALTVDAGLWYLEHRRLRNAADTAALAAAGNPAQAQSIAALLMSPNGFAAANLVAVTPGHYCASTLIPPASRLTTRPPASADGHSVVCGKSASVRVERGGRIIPLKKNYTK